MPVGTDAIGTRGEAIVTNLLTRRHGRDQPFFRPQFLGDKYPTIDFFVELVGVVGPQTPFFLVQTSAFAKETTLRILFDEVHAFWRARDVLFSHSTFA